MLQGKTWNCPASLPRRCGALLSKYINLVDAKVAQFFADLLEANTASLNPSFNSGGSFFCCNISRHQYCASCAWLPNPSIVLPCFILLPRAKPMDRITDFLLTCALTFQHVTTFFLEASFGQSQKSTIVKSSMASSGIGKKRKQREEQCYPSLASMRWMKNVFETLRSLLSNHHFFTQ